jgi:hypothetical protein
LAISSPSKLRPCSVFDLGAIGFQKRMRFGHFACDAGFRGFGHRRAMVTAAAGHLGADRAQLGHDLAMHRAEVAAFGGHGHGSVAHNGFFDTKTFATNRHEFFSHPFTSGVLDRCDLTSGSRGNMLWSVLREPQTND